MMTSIVPNLYLGDIDDAANKWTVFSLNIDLIVNCTNHEKHYFKTVRDPKRIFYYRVPVNDDCKKKSLTKMSSLLPSAVTKIHESIKNNLNVLIHCHKGRQRSASIVTAYLMKHENMSLEEAVAYVKERRVVAFLPENNFESSLRLYEKSLQNFSQKAPNDANRKICKDIG
ncbi:MAG: dual specificity protein phosphatase family protein [Sphingobacteriaceae bacterium]|nr:MAG: dual specificity protein phosphatase family protein [Sphingobacteriaceae bacterium]